MTSGGGIFKGPNALGLSAFGEVGVSCQHDNVALVKQVQTYLKSHGAPNLKVDGQWQGCTASAFNKVFGRQYVTNDDIKLMTGKSCSSDDLIGNISLAFTIPGINTCTDGSDGVSVGGGGGSTPEQECPAGQCWNQLTRSCLPDPFGLMCPKQSTPTPEQTKCPSGQTWFEALKACLPVGPMPPGGMLPGESAPTECKPGANYKNPLTGKCTGDAGIEIVPTECGQGLMKNPLTGNCIPQIPGLVPPGGGGGGGGGECPAGQVNVPFLGCITNPFGGGQQGQPSGGSDLNSIIGGAINSFLALFGGGIQPSQACPDGSVWNGSQCVAGGGVKPATASALGNTTYVVGGLLALGAVVGGVAYLKHRESQQMLGVVGLEESDGELLADLGLSSEDGFVPYDEFEGADYGMFTANRRRRHRRSRRSRRSRRGCGCRR